jgi:hypothetical protein
MSGGRNMKPEESRKTWTSVTGKTYGPISEQEYLARRAALRKETERLVKQSHEIASQGANYNK